MNIKFSELEIGQQFIKTNEEQYWAKGLMYEKTTLHKCKPIVLGYDNEISIDSDTLITPLIQNGFTKIKPKNSKKSKNKSKKGSKFVKKIITGIKFKKLKIGQEFVITNEKTDWAKDIIYEKTKPYESNHIVFGRCIINAKDTCCDSETSIDNNVLITPLVPGTRLTPLQAKAQIATIQKGFTQLKTEYQ